MLMPGTLKFKNIEENPTIDLTSAPGSGSRELKKAQSWTNSFLTLTTLSERMESLKILFALLKEKVQLNEAKEKPPDAEKDNGNDK